jgi:hypothetical protein
MTRVADWGPCTIETDCDQAVLATLALWFPTYLSRFEDERQLDRNTFTRPDPRASYDSALEDETFPDAKLPAIVVTTAQMTAPPEKDGDGFLYAGWRVGLTCVVRGRTPRESRFVAAAFAGCARRIMLDRPDLGGFAGGVRLTGGRVARVRDATDKGRYLAAGMSEFTVYVDEVLREGGGPVEADPYVLPDPAAPGYDPDAPYDALATVADVTTTITTRS